MARCGPYPDLGGCRRVLLSVPHGSLWFSRLGDESPRRRMLDYTYPSSLGPGNPRPALFIAFVAAFG